MKRTVSAVAVSALALTAGLVSTPATASASPASVPASVSQGMVFVQNDDPAGNQVVAYRRSADGTLQAGTYPTGGRGGTLNGAIVDRLASQGSLTYDKAHRTLYAVNAGSNTVTVFGVAGDRLIRRQVIPFAAVFDRFGRLAVAEAGSNSVATYAVEPGRRLRLLNRTATGQMATCWIVGAEGNYYLSNAGSNSLAGYHAESDGSPVGLGNTATGEGTVDAAATPDQRYIYVQTGKVGAVDAFRVGSDGSLTKISSTVVPNAAGAEGIAAS